MSEYLSRELEKTIKKYIRRKEIIAVIGPRQCGKTTLINHVFKQLKNTNSLSFDNIKTKELFEKNIDEFINLHIRGFDYVFIDEIQYASESGKKLKYIFDQHHTKLFVSGSSATELSIQSIKYLVGRIFILKLFPLSFLEFMTYKSPKLLPLLEKDYSNLITQKINTLLNEFLVFGGYPEVVLAKDKEEKQIVLSNLFNTYLLKEIREILNLREDYKLLQLLKALAWQVGSPINYHELSEISGFHYPDLKQYLNVLDKTFICRPALNFHTNKRQELKKSPKMFFYDNGFRNIAIDNLSLKDKSDKARLYENFTASELIKQDLELKYWRTKAKAEVDFIVKDEHPIEIKSMLKKPAVTKSFLSFIEQYHPKKAFVFSNNLKANKKIQNTNIKFLPLFEASQLKTKIN